MVDADKDQGHWAAENRSLLQMAVKCLVSLLAKKAAAQKSVPLSYFPSQTQPSQAAKLLHELFYQELAQRIKTSDSEQNEQVLFTVAGQPACLPLVLLSPRSNLPSALQKLQAPVVVVSEVVMHGLQGADPSIFQRLSPASLRWATLAEVLRCSKPFLESDGLLGLFADCGPRITAIWSIPSLLDLLVFHSPVRSWLRQLPVELHQFCDPETLIFALRDGARLTEGGKRAEDLNGCPLALTADGKVRQG